MSSAASPPPPDPDNRTDSTPRPRNRLLLFTVGALLVGLVLGGALGYVSHSQPAAPSSPGAAESPVATATPGAGDVAVNAVVPRQCLDAAQQASDALTTAQDGLSAVADFDAARLREVLRSLQSAQPVVQDLAEQCRAQASASASTLPSVTPLPSAS